MAIMRVNSRVVVRSDAQTLDGTSAKTGKAWSMRLQQVIDSDLNKVELALPDKMAPLEEGCEYDLVLDVEVDRRNTPNARIIKAERVKQPAAAGAAAGTAPGR